MDSISQKQCTKCQCRFPQTREHFSPDKKSKDGLKTVCKNCRSKASSEYHKRKMDDPTWAAAKRAKALEDYHHRRLNHPEIHAAISTRHKEKMKLKRQQTPNFNELRRTKRNVKRENEVRAIRRANDPSYREHVNKATRERRAANPDYWRLKNRIYSAKRRSQMGTIHYTQADIRLQYSSQNERCWHCGDKLNGKYHIDHLIPLSRGGTDKASNIVISCPLCNERKHDKFTWEWNGRLL